MPCYVHRSVMSICDMQAFSGSYVTNSPQVLSRYTLGCELVRQQKIGWLNSM